MNKKWISFFRNLRVTSITAGFIAFFLGLVTTRDIINIPFFNIINYLQLQNDPLIDGTIIEIIALNLSAFLTYFIPTMIITGFIIFKFSGEDGETIIRGSSRVEPAELRRIILKDIQKLKEGNNNKGGILKWLHLKKK